MGRVLPKHSVVPRVGKEVDVLVGEPVYLEDLAMKCKLQGEEQKCAWKEITERISHALKELEKKAPANPDQVPGKEAADVLRPSEGALPASNSSSG